jgi:hypothetical protein
MSKLLAGLISALLVGVGVAAASSLNADDDPTRTGPTVSTLDTGTTGTTETTKSTRTTPTTPTTPTTRTGEEVSGPCDEAEHANEPRCNGAATADDRDDDEGHGRSGHRGGDDRDDDRSGSNSGRG